MNTYFKRCEEDKERKKMEEELKNKRINGYGICYTDIATIIISKSPKQKDITTKDVCKLPLYGEKNKWQTFKPYFLEGGEYVIEKVAYKFYGFWRVRPVNLKIEEKNVSITKVDSFMIKSEGLWVYVGLWEEFQLDKTAIVGKIKVKSDGLYKYIVDDGVINIKTTQDYQPMPTNPELQTTISKDFDVDSVINLTEDWVIKGKKGKKIWDIYNKDKATFNKYFQIFKWGREWRLKKK